MSDPLETRTMIERFVAGYQQDIHSLEEDQRRTDDAASLDAIRRTLDAKQAHLQRHLATLQAMPV